MFMLNYRLTLKSFMVAILLLNFCRTSNSYFLSNKQSKTLAKRNIDVTNIKPYLTNCLPDVKSAREQYFLIRNGFSLVVLYEGTSEYENPLRYFKFMFDAWKWSEFEEPEIYLGGPFFLHNFVKKGENVIYFPPYRAVSGLFMVTLMAKPISDKKVQGKVSVKHCYFMVKALPPIIVLNGGFYRKVPPKIVVKIDGAHSMDLNRPLNIHNIRSLSFQWRCNEKVGSFCNKMVSRQTYLNIPEDVVVENQLVNVSVVVESSMNTSSSMEAVVEVETNAAMLRVSCEKNCPPATDVSNTQSITFFRASCEANCADIAEEHYEWEIRPRDGDSDFKFDYAKETHFGRVGPKFVVSKDVLKPDEEYLVTLTLKSEAGKPGKTIIAVKYAAAPKVEKCEIKPPKGKSLETLFKLKCAEEQLDKDNFYELFADEDFNELVISGFNPDVSLVEFFMPPSEGRSFKVRVTKGGGPAVILDVFPQVSAASEGKNSSEILDIYDRFVNGKEGSISNLILSDDPAKKQKGIDMFQALANEITATEPTPEMQVFAKNMTYAIVTDLLKSPQDDSAQLASMSESISNIIEHHELAKNDTLLAKLSTSVCKLMVTTHAEEIKKAKFPLNSETQFNTIGSILTKCMEANVRENFDLISPAEFNLTVIEMPASKIGEDLKEDYPNYVDFKDDYNDHIENLNHLTNNVVDACAAAAKSLALTTAVGEHFSKRSGNFSAILVAKDMGKDLAKTRVQLLDAVLVPSSDFRGVEHPFDILVSYWSKDILWWNHNKAQVSTSILGVQFWHSSCKKRIRRFKSPLSLLLDIKPASGFEERILQSNASVPDGYDAMSGPILNEVIGVHRIGILAGSVVHVQFYNLIETDKFDVVLTKFEFPSFENFKVNVTVAADRNNYMRIINYNSYDVWGYLGVLPSKKEPSVNPPPVIYYDVSFLMTFCVRWSRADRAWKPDCKPGLASTRYVINCECNHFSVIAGYQQNAETIFQKFIEVDYELEMQSHFIIFVTLVITYALYCLLMLLVTFKQKAQIYFLSDNSKSNRYAYLITVRTENARNAGTTSHIMMKLIGSKMSSEPHVLNYPDPKMHLLQKQGEDMFVLLTKGHLGTVKKVEMWYDCTGQSPSWHCRDIVVYDLQTQEQWYFKIKTIFSLTHGTAHLVKTPSDTEKFDTIFNRFRVCNHFHTWELWASEKNFSFVARLTTVFSIILNVYSTVLRLQGVPEFELRDAFNFASKFRIRGGVVGRGLLAACISFSIHIVVAWVFRFSNIEFSAFGKTYAQAYNVSLICWAFLICSISWSTTSLVAYGFWVPRFNSWAWLTSSLIAILFDVVVLENAFIIVQTFFCKFKLTLAIDKRIGVYLKTIENQRQVLYKKLDAEMLRPYLTHLYKPLEAIQIIKRRTVAQLRRGIYDDLEDLFMYGIYNIILYIMILVKAGGLIIASKNEVSSMIEAEHTRTLQFSKIWSIAQVYEYMNFTLIPTMHPPFWYGNYSIGGGGNMIDNTYKYVGIARLRQHRMSADACPTPDLMKFMNMTCMPEFALSLSESDTFGPKWTKFIAPHGYERLKSVWDYQSEHDTGTLVALGHIAAYSGGGYVAYLGRSLYNSYANFLYLAKNFWLDHKTRSVFIEFLLYNANFNVFVAVNLVVEYSATGYISKWPQITVVRMLFVQNEIESMTLVFFALFILWVALLMLKLSIGIIKHIRTFYKRTWLMIDLMINIMSLISIAAFIMRMKMVKHYLEALEAVQHNEFVSYFNMLYFEEFLTIFSALLVGIATIRLWRFLRFGIFFRIMERTLVLASSGLMAVTFNFFVMLTAFGLSGILIYGNEYPELSNFIQIVGTLIQLALKPDQFDITVYLDFKVTYYYFSLYLLMMQVVLLVYITVIIMAYVKAQLEFSVEPESYNVGDYIKEQAVYLPKLIRTKIYRFRGGQKEEKSPVTSKADEFRYANCLSVAKSSMEAMQFLTSCVIRNMEQTATERTELTEHEVIMMLGVCRTFVLQTHEGDEVEVFFKGHFAGQKMQLVDEKKIDKMGDIVKMMFRRREEGEEREVKTSEYMTQMTQLVKRKNRILKGCKLRLKLMLFQFKEIERVVNDLYIQ